MPLMEPEQPARAAKTTMTDRPTTRVRLAPKRLENQPTISMATAVTIR